MLPKIENYPEYPSIPTDVLDRSDESARQKLLEDDSLYSKAAEELTSLQDTETGNDTSEVESVETDNPVETKTPGEEVKPPVEETTTKETSPESTDPAEPKEESSVEVENPFKAVGMPDDVFQHLIEQGVIREGKLHGLYGADEIGSFWDYYKNDSKLRGQLANKIHDEKKEKEALSHEVNKTREELLKTKQESLKEKQKALTLAEQLKSISSRAEKTEPLLFSQDLIPTGLTQEQAELVRKLALDRTRTDLYRKFQSRGVPFPDTQEDWEELRLEHNDLFSLADAKRDENYNSQVKWAITSLGVDRAYENLIKDSFLQSSYDFVETLQTSGFPVDEETPEVKSAVEKAISALNKERELASAEGRSPDPRYFESHPITGHAFLKSDAVTSFIALNDRATWSKLQSGQFTIEEENKSEPVAVETSTDTDTQSYTVSLADALEEFANYLSSNFQLNFPQDSPELQKAVSAIAEKRDDPRYWSNGGLRKESLIGYFSTENPSFIAGLLNTKVEEQYKTRLEEATKKAQEILLERKARAEDGVVLAGSSTQGQSPDISATGAQIPLPSVEVFKNPFAMRRLAEQNNMDVDALFDILDQQISKIPDPNLREEYLRT